MKRVLRLFAALLAFGLVAACGGGDPAPDEGSPALLATMQRLSAARLGGQGTANPLVPPRDCTSARAFWQNLVDTGFFTAALVDPYLPDDAPVRLATAAWATRIPSLASAFPGYQMRIDFFATGVEFGRCKGRVQPVKLKITASWSVLYLSAIPYDGSWEPITVFHVNATLPVDARAAVDRTLPFRTVAQALGHTHHKSSAASFELGGSGVGSFDLATAIPMSLWTAYLARARDPYMPPDNGCASAYYFWNDWWRKNVFRSTVNDNNLRDFAPIRLKTDAWNGDIPEVPARYPGQDMELLHEVYQIDVSGCQPGQPAIVTMRILSRWFAVFNDQYSHLFSLTVAPRVDTTLRLDLADPLATAAATMPHAGDTTAVDSALIETFIEWFDIRVLDRYWWVLLQHT